MTGSVLLVGCRRLPEGDGDEAEVLPALADVGVKAGWAVWDDETADFGSADLVVLRATWDYEARRGEFLDWCGTVPQLRNPLDVVRWSTDKAYLVELAAEGVPVVPTELVTAGLPAEWPAGRFVVKPSVGAGSRGAALFDGTDAADSERAAQHLGALHDAGRAVLVQPYQERVSAEGETAVVFLGGVYSHAFTKGAMLEGSELDGSGLFVAERTAVAEPPAEVRALAEDALDAAGQLIGVSRHELLYARVDVVRGGDGRPLLLELELAEPSLGLRHGGPGAVPRFASAIRSALG